MRIRPPAVAGLFYPAEAARLSAQVDACLAAARPHRGAPPKALIAPHAGYAYSGPIAGSAFAALGANARRIERVVLIGPAHRVWLRGLAVPLADAFATPLGSVPLDREAIERIAKLPQVSVHDAAHAREHSLEVELPFLQRVLAAFQLVPLAAGDASAEAVAEVLETLWGGDETLILISTDLSHYQPWEIARALDARTARAIESLDVEGLGEDSACGRVPVRGLLTSARRRRLAVHRLDLRNSGDTAGPRDEVVGYGAWALCREPIDATAHTELVSVAHCAVAHAVREGGELRIDPAEYAPALRAWASSFVTLRQAGALRGCIGSLEPERPLVADVARNARRAATADPRFAPVCADELDSLAVHVSVLGPLERLEVATRAQLVAALRPGLDGLVLEQGARRGTFLPAVWQQLRSAEEFVRELERKAGLDGDAWREPVRCWRYGVEEPGD